MEKTYSVRKVKHFQGNDGLSYAGELLHNGKLVADIHDDGNGGCVSIHWRDSNLARLKMNMKNRNGEKFVRSFTPQELKLHKHCLALGQVRGDVTYHDGAPMMYDDELFIGELVFDHIEIKSMKNSLSRLLQFIETPESKSIYHFPKMKFSDLTAQKVRAKYPKCVILNELSTEKAFAIWRNQK